MRKPLVLVVVGVLSGVGTLVACGNDDSGSNGVTADSGTFDGGSSSGSSGSSSGSSGSSGGSDGGSETGVDSGLITNFHVAMTGTGACAVFEDGTMKCWGKPNVDTAQTTWGNAPGQMGAALPFVKTPAPVKKVAGTSEGGFCAVFVDGTARCWAMTDSGQGNGVGIGSLEGVKTNIDFGVGRTVVDIAAAATHACAILDNGKVKCWGQGTGGLLGNGSSADQATPGAELDLGTGRTAKALTASFYFTCALLDDDRVKCWGYGGLLANGGTANVGDMPGQMGDNLAYAKLGTDPTTMAPWKVKKVVASHEHACAILANDRVKCWGSGSASDTNEGVMGNGANDVAYGTTIVDDDIPFVDLDKDAMGNPYTVTDISMGVFHVCVNTTKDGGRTYCWGNNEAGILGTGNGPGAIGDGPNEMGSNLVPVGLKTGRKASALYASDLNVCARVDTTVLNCWGYNHNGAIGVGLPDSPPSDAIGDESSELGAGMLETLLK